MRVDSVAIGDVASVGRPANVCDCRQVCSGVAAHLPTAGILTPSNVRATPELLLRSCSPKPSAEHTRRAGAAWDVDQVQEDGQVECRAAHGGADGCAHVLARAHPRARQALRRRLSSPPRPVRGPLNDRTVTSLVTDFPSPQE